LAFEGCYRLVGELLADWYQAIADINKMIPDATTRAMRTQLAALDRQSMVILGDPTVAVPRLS